MTTQPAIDREKVKAFMDRVQSDFSGTLVTAMCILGDRLRLFRVLAAHGPATSQELADRAGIQERYAREWLSALTAGGYLTYDPASGRFALPAEHALAFAQEGGPLAMGGFLEMLSGLLGVLDPLTEAFRRGGGVHQSAYSERMWDGLERHSGLIYEHLLVRRWLPEMPDVRSKLESGALVADVGCGRGRALIKLAQTFPNSRYVGYDVFEPTVARATANAEAAGVADRVRFQALDAAKGLPELYDIITTFDVVHDAVDPRGLLRAIRQGLRPDGRYVCGEVTCSERLEDNAGPIGAMFYGTSVLYCLTTSLANYGEGLGAMGLPEPKLRQLCAEAGFGHFRRVPVDNPFTTIYEAWS
ncbi:MAG TPA: methyltransferase domain-containing protein [Dehalococcoidia bacterium]|nr:methyltransferase domain-containing protein [Dehalococcoidia bacterium]